MEELGRLVTADDCIPDARLFALRRLFEVGACPVAYEVVLRLIALPNGGPIVELRLAQLAEAGT